MNSEKLLGAWWLSESTQGRNGEVSKSFGDPPSGQLQYTADGRMSAFLMDPIWKEAGTNACKQAHLFFAYAGTWRIEGNHIHHQIEFCSAPSKIGLTFIRTLKLTGDDKLELITEPETSPSGHVYESRLVWRKLKPT